MSSVRVPRDEPGGYVAKRRPPEAAIRALEQKLPRECRIDQPAARAVRKRVCTGRPPKCSICPLLAYRRQV